MAEFRKSAVKIMQGKRALFLTSLVVRDFVDGFYRVEKLDIEKSKGAQRLLNEKRARSFGEDILAAHKKNDAFLPTSVFLATGGSIGYDEDTQEMFFDSDDRAGVCPLDVVDGQHRIWGLKEAAEKENHLLDFPISAVIAPNMSKDVRMREFVVVNTQQRPVDAGVTQHIIARFTGMLNVEKMPHLPKWLDKEVRKGHIKKSLDLGKKLSTDEESPWYGRIRLADDDTGKSRIRQASFVKSVNHTILTKNHPLNYVAPNDPDKQYRILRNYWTAVEKICVAPAEGEDAGTKSVVFKYTGLVFFLSILAPVLHQLVKSDQYTVDAIEKCIRSAQDHLDTEYATVLTPDFWQVGSTASGFNRSAISKHAAAFANALSQAHTSDIQV